MGHGAEGTGYRPQAQGTRLAVQGTEGRSNHQTPTPHPFRAPVTGTPDGLTWEAGGGGGGPEVPQHMWLKMIPTMR